MSKIVMLTAQLGAPQIMNDLLCQLKNKNPLLAEFIEQLEILPLIRECAENAIAFLARQNGISRDTAIYDFYGNRSCEYHGMKIIGALKTQSFDKGLGIIVDKDGTIRYTADVYRGEWKAEADRLTKLFQDAFMAESVKAILLIMGYEVQIRQEVRRDAATGEESVFTAMEGIKQ